ncbi:SAM-dependent methyltransferase [Pseudonocardiaceae bacterium YIM PH 21723]|nr:SAM-dependent methyltransferase [Pseudonocardiaceae bacterium YIM PH 21723]
MGQHADWDIVTGIGATALAVAAARSIETHRPDRLVADPLAAVFVRAARPGAVMPTGPEDGGDEPMWQAMATYLGVRSRFFDEYFAQSGVTQAVLLASGLDLRGYRLDWPDGTSVYELDMPKVLDFKLEVLVDNNAVPTADVRNVQIDLRDDWPTALLDAGFDPKRRTAWLAEGLLPFLPEEATVALFSNMHRLSAPGSLIAAEHIVGDPREVANDPTFRNMQEEYGLTLEDLWPHDKTYDPAAWLTDNGWAVTSEYAEKVAERFGRPFGEHLDSFRGNLFLTARR